MKKPLFMSCTLGALGLPDVFPVYSYPNVVFAATGDLDAFQGPFSAASLVVRFT